MTNKKQIERLKEPYRSQAFENLEKYRTNTDDDLSVCVKQKTSCFTQTLWCAFVWGNTHQGNEYWCNIVENPQNYTTDGKD